MEERRRNEGRVRRVGNNLGYRARKYSKRRRIKEGNGNLSLADVVMDRV